MPAEATLRDDPNVKLPNAIKASAERAAQIHKEAYQKDPPKDLVDPPKPTDPPADPPKPTDPPADPPKPTDPPVDPVTLKGNEAEPKGGWEHAFKSMKGRFERSQEANRALMDRVSGLEATIAGMQVAPPANAPKDPALTPDSFLTPKEVADYGEDFLGVVGKKAKEIVSPEVAALKKQVASLEAKLGNVGQTVTKNAREDMKAQLKSEVPNWEQVNVNSDFLEWLALPDPLSGAIRHNLLKDAWGRNDAARVANFFKGFLATEATGTPLNDPAPTQTGKVPLETFAAPGRAKTAAATTDAPAEKPIITRVQIADFYRDKTAQKYRGREKEADAFEAQIWAAQREGRIR